MSEEEQVKKYSVQLYVYDLSRGMARSMSQTFLGVQIDAVYHTSIVYNDVEIFYGAGIQRAVPGSTHHGYPEEIVKLGESEIPPEVFDDYVNELAEEYTHDRYNLFEHNCNHFSEQLAQFLVGKSIPDTVTNLPASVLATPFGQMLRPYIEGAMQSTVQMPS